MKYLSTRGSEKNVSFRNVLLNGLASDGGLYVPEKIPSFSKQQILKFKTLTYYELAYEVTKSFVLPDISNKRYFEICKKTYDNFSDKEVLSIDNLNSNEYLLNLFHGPTLAFKDFALQLLGNIYDYFLKKENINLTIIGATSGDTGSAAISGCLKSDLIKMFIFFPYKKVSEIQRRQMTTVLNPKLFKIAVKGNFDDCQNLVKSLFENNKKRKSQKFAAVNSINWVRIMGQIVYYFWSYLNCSNKFELVNFIVPTGNFGNVYAGFISKKMGLPINKLVVASNSNDVLTRFFETGKMEMHQTIKTLSPSMDIQISSNFERLLFFYLKKKKDGVSKLYSNLKKNKKFIVEKDILVKILNEFVGGRVDDVKTKDTILEIYKKFKIVLDPHTAVGVRVGREKTHNKEKNIFLATAHYGKFMNTIEISLKKKIELPHKLRELLTKKEQFEIFENNLEQIEMYILGNS